MYLGSYDGLVDSNVYSPLFGMCRWGDMLKRDSRQWYVQGETSWLAGFSSALLRIPPIWSLSPCFGRDHGIDPQVNFYHVRRLWFSARAGLLVQRDVNLHTPGAVSCV